MVNISEQGGAFDMAECERCGRKAKLTLVEIEGAQMYLCPDCSRYGKVVQRREEPPPQRKVSAPRPKQPRRPDVLSREKELAQDYPRRIQRGREKLGLSREELGRKINERVSVIAKLEHGEMHPPDSLVKKLEKTLGIELMEDVEEVHISSSASSTGMTLADFIVRKK